MTANTWRPWQTHMRRLAMIEGLRQFYLDKIALFRTAPFSGDERKTRIATLRRGLVPALTRMKDYAGAVDQYIELINNFPEDAGLVTEAALYALRYQRQQQLLEFYARRSRNRRVIIAGRWCWLKSKPAWNNIQRQSRATARQLRSGPIASICEWRAPASKNA